MSEQKQQISSILANIERIINDRNVSGSSWAEIERLLDDASALVAGDSTAEAELAMSRQGYIQQWRDKVIRSLDEVADSVMSADPDKVRKLIRDAEDAALPEDEAAVQARADDLRAQFEARTIAEDLELAIEDLYAEAQESWQQGKQKFHSNLPQQEIVFNFFAQPYQKVRSLALAHPDNEALQQLTETAKAEYDAARDKALMPRTLLAEGRYQELLDRIDGAVEDEHFEIHDEEGTLQNLPKREALTVVKRLIARHSNTYAESTEGPIERALMLLAQQKPLQAQDELQKAEDLLFLKNRIRIRIRKIVSDQVMPELELFNRAEQLAQDAISNASRIGPAWQQYLAAKEIYPAAPRVEEARGRLIASANSEYDRLIEQAREKIEDNYLAAGRETLQRIQQYPVLMELQDDVSAIRELYDRVGQIEQEQEDLPGFMARIKNLIVNRELRSFQQADQELKEFLTRYPRADKRSTELRQLLQQVTVNVDLSQLPVLLRESYNSKDLAEIETAIEQCYTALESNEAPAKKHKIDHHLALLQQRQDVLYAKQLWRERGNVELAHKQLTTFLETGTEPEDRQDARALLTQIEASLDEEEELLSIRPQVERLVDAGTLEPAFELLKPYFTQPYIAGEVGEWRQRTWLKINEELGPEARDRLTVLLQDEDTDRLEDIQRYSEMIVRLGVPHPPELIRTAQERGAVLQATRYEHASQWDSAVEAWQNARRLNPGQTSYHSRFLVAKQRAVRKQLDDLLFDQEDPHAIENAEQVAREYMELATDQLEPKSWYLDILVRKAARARTPRDFDAGWLRANSDLSFIQHLAARYLKDTGIKASQSPEYKEIKTLSDRIAQGRENAKKILQLERQFNTQQNLNTLHNAVQQIDELLKTHADYVGIEHWWETERRPGLQNELEQQIAQLGEDVDYWDLLDPYGCLLVVTGGHNQAQEHIEALPEHAVDLIGRARTLVNDVKGARYLNEVEQSDQHQILDLQLIDVQSLNTLTRTAELCARFFTSLLSDNTEKQWRTDLSAMREALTDKRGELRQLIEAFDTALAFASVPGKSGDWGPFEDTIEEFKLLCDGKYQNHLALIVANKRREAYTHQREIHIQIIEDIKVSFVQQRVKAIRVAVDRLFKEDLQNDFGLRTEGELFGNPESRLRLTGFSSLLRWLETQEARINVLQVWLERLVYPGITNRLLTISAEAYQAIELSDEQDVDILNYSQLSLANNTRIVDWTVAKAEALETARRGDFSRAYATVQDVIGNDAPDDEDSFTLTQAIDHLRFPPLLADDNEDGQFTSDEEAGIHVQSLALFGAALLKKLDDQLNAARQQLTDIKNEARDFVNLLNRFDKVYMDVRGQKNKDDVTLQEAIALHTKITSIAPFYTGIYPLPNYPELAE